MTINRHGRLRPLASIRLRFIADLRHAWRFWSVRLSLLGAAMSAGWAALPADSRALIPGAQWIGLFLFVSVTLARLIDQPGARQ